MASINPFIYFKGNCKEAMTFYQAILGGELQLLTGGETLTGICHPEMRDLIFYSRISVGQTFLQVARGALVMCKWKKSRAAKPSRGCTNLFCTHLPLP